MQLAGVSGVGGGRDSVLGWTLDPLSRELQSSSKLWAFWAGYTAMCSPKTAHLGLKESQLCKWLSFTIKQQQKATVKDFCFKLRNCKCLLESNRICPPSSQNRPKVCFRRSLALGHCFPQEPFAQLAVCS